MKIFLYKIKSQVYIKYILNIKFIIQIKYPGLIIIIIAKINLNYVLKLILIKLIHFINIIYK